MHRIALFTLLALAAPALAAERAPTVAAQNFDQLAKPLRLPSDPETDQPINRVHETALSGARSLTPRAPADRPAHWAA